MLLRLMFSDICNEGRLDKPMDKTVCCVTYCSLNGEKGTLLYCPSCNPSSTHHRISVRTSPPPNRERADQARCTKGGGSAKANGLLVLLVPGDVSRQRGSVRLLLAHPLRLTAANGCSTKKEIQRPSARVISSLKQNGQVYTVSSRRRPLEQQLTATMYKKGKFINLLRVVPHLEDALPVHLESRVGVGEQLDKVGLEPLASLGSGLEGIRQAAVVVVAGGAGIAGTVTLATGLDPGKGVEEGVAGVGAGANAEAGALPMAISNVRTKGGGGRGEKLTIALHQSPHCCWPVGCLPLRPVSVMNWAGKPALLRRGEMASI